MKRKFKAAKPVVASENQTKFSRVTAFIVAVENYRMNALPVVDYAHADAEAFAEWVSTVYTDLADAPPTVTLLKDSDASLAALQSDLAYAIQTLQAEELFIFYYAGHGFHGAGGNRLSAYDTNRVNIAGTSLMMRDDLLEPLQASACQQALIFVDACAENFKGVVKSRDVISNLEADEVDEFLNENWYLGVFLSCSPGEKSFPSTGLKHGIWTHFLLEALNGRAPEALTRDRWLTDVGLRDYLRKEVPHYITYETTLKATQRPQAILNASGSFKIHHVEEEATEPLDASLSSIKLHNTSVYLEGVETGAIRSLDGFSTAKRHRVPTDQNDAAELWCRRLLDEQVTGYLQHIYDTSKSALTNGRRRVRKEYDLGMGDVHSDIFRYSIVAGQNPDDPSEFEIRHTFELREGWEAERDAIEEILDRNLDSLIISFSSLDESFEELVDRIEDISEASGGHAEDDSRTGSVSYSHDDTTFNFNVKKNQLEIWVRGMRDLELLDQVQKIQLGITNKSPMLAPPLDT